MKKKLSIIVVSCLFVGLSACSEKARELTEEVKTQIVIGSMVQKSGAKSALTIDKAGNFSMFAAKNGEKITPCDERKKEEACRSPFPRRGDTMMQSTSKQPTKYFDETMRVVSWEGSECITIYWRDKEYEICSPPY